MLLSPLLAQVAATLLTLAPLARSLSVERRASTCNGHPELCGRSYGNVSFVGAHDSYAVGTDLSSNQDHDVTTQLNDGVRLLQVQALQQSDGVHLCHTSCILKDGGLAVSYFSKVKQWVSQNPNDVVTILVVNINNLPASSWDAVFKSAGLDSFAFVPSSGSMPASGWPTLGSMIDSGKRVVIFLDNQADFTSVPYIIDEFSNVFEDPFDVVEASFPCTVNRTSGDTSTQMYLTNHYLDSVVTIAGFSVPAPDKNQLTVTNAASGAGSLGEGVATCTAAHSRPPNFMLVDFYEFGGGSVFQVAANLNGVSYSPSTPIASPVSGNSSSGTTSTPLNAALDPFISRREIVMWCSIVASIFAGAWAVL